jgi:hypothetical protein
MYFELLPNDSTPGGVGPDQLFPIKLRDKVGDGLAFHVVLQTEEPGNGLIEIKDAPLFIHHEHTVLNGIEERFQESPFSGQSLHHALQPLRVEPADASQNLVNKTGLRSHGENLEIRRPKSEGRKKVEGRLNISQDANARLVENLVGWIDDTLGRPDCCSFRISGFSLRVSGLALRAAAYCDRLNP